MKRRIFAWLMVFVMLISTLPTTAFADQFGPGGNGPGQGGGNGEGGGNQPGSSTYNHIDVRVDGSVTFETKVNGVTTSTETIAVTVSHVSATLNSTAITFYEKSGTGTENEWRCDGLSLDPTSDRVVITCTVVGTRADGTPINMTLTLTYSEESVLRKFISACPGQNGYDIDIVAEDLTELFTIDVEATKVWDDDDNRDGSRPTSVQFQLYADGVASGDPVAVSAATNWKVTFENLLKYASNGSEIVYTVDEVAVPTGYTKTVEGYTITNSHTPERTSISGTKTWVDADNQDGKRPSSITITVWNGSTAVKTETVTPDADGNWTIGDLLKYENGVEISYTITEGAVDGYESSVDGYDVTNTHTPEKVSVSGSKTWSDANNQDGVRPESITIRLYADGTEVASKTVSEEDNWAWNFTDLDKYANGAEISYTITEDAVSGYTSSVNGYNVTNTHTPETIEISGKKTWNDADNQDGIRPESITIRLWADGTEVASKTVSEEDNWAWTFTDLPKNAAGKEITYTITEDAVDGYESSVDGYNVTNTHTPAVTSVSGSKTWSDADNQDGKRPESITIRLLANGTEVDFKTVTEADGWAWSFTNLPEYANGVKITYTISEDAVEGYTPSVNGYNVTNTHTPETIDISGKKTWDDNDNQDGKRPESITINLLANKVEVDSVEVKADEDGNWTWSFTGLPKYKDGKEIEYTITEVTVDGYTAVVDGYNVTNTHKIEKTEVKVTKVWDDADNQDGKRPDSITINLLAGGEKTGKTLELNADNNWSGSFTDLDVYAGGEEIVYSIEEVSVAGYETKITGTAATGYTVTNSYTPETTSVSGSKTWDDADNQDGVRPDSITINLLANGEKVDSVEVKADEDGNWKWSFTDLPKYSEGKEIDYTISEDAVDGYEATVSGYNVTNSHTPETTSVSGSKTWVDNGNAYNSRPESITIILKADGEEVDSKTVTAENDWAWSFENLPKYKDQGTEIVYTIEEAAVEGYDTVINGTDVTNTYNPGTINIPVTKVWDDADDQDGKRSASVTVELVADKEATGKTVTLSEANDWTDQFTDLPAYVGGVKVDYTVKEVEIHKDYESTISGDESGYTITNQYTPVTKEITVTKTWEDNDNQDGVRPSEITVNLLANGTKVKSATVSADANGNWTVTFENLPVYRDHGTEIEYTVTEEEVDGYDTAIDGYSITNTHTPEKIKISGTKTWVDEDNQDGKRPESITVRLWKGETEVAYATVGEAENWTWKFIDLDKYENGEEIKYTITEDEVAEYTTKISGYNVTNTHAVEKTTFTVTKKWEDNDNRDGLRAEEVEVQLYADGEAYGDAVTLSEENKWSYTWEDLDVYSGGKAIEYTVEEVKVAEGYDASVEDGTITNTHEVALTEVSVTKVWDDAEDQDGLRPATIQVQLYANGNPYGEPVTLNAEKLSHTWTKLYVNENGEPIKYTVDEVEVPEGYDKDITGSAAEGYTITNTHIPEETSVTVTKKWSDANNQDGKRPKEVVVTLWADGVKTEKTVTLNKGNDWTATFEGLAKKSAGKDIVYTVVEETVEDYSSVITKTTDGYTITNVYSPETTSVQVKKAWDDKNDQDGIRPDAITVTLYADGEATDKTLELNETNNWSGSFTGLDKFRDEGMEIVYTVEESDVTGYEAAIAVDETTGVIVITNTHAVELTEYTVKKVWKDDENRDGIRPDSILVQLYKNGDPLGEEVALSEENSWTYTWTELDKKANGEEVVYSVEEVEVPEGYTASVEGGVITNTHEIETVDIAGSKTWDDANDQDGKRPESITIHLLANGEEIKSVTVSGSDWAWEFTNLPKNADGEEIEYTITEDAVAGYETTVNGYNVTNTHEVEKIDIDVTKVWNDADNQDGGRPAEITVSLLANGEETGKTLTLKEGAWSGSFTDLDKYADGEEITYSVAEVEVPEGYTSTISGDAETGFTITNSSDPKKTSVLVTKVWDDILDQDGIRPEEITVKLLADGEETGKTLTLSAKNGWQGAFTDLDAYANGVAITYDVEEVQVEGYEVYEVWNEDGTAVTLINKHNVELTSVTVTKVWDDADNQDGIRPDAVEVQLMADGVVASIPVVLNADNHWTFTWEILPVNAAGKAITYTVEEITEIEGYTTEITGNAADGYTVTNSHTPETISLTVEKVWDDADNQDGKRPASVTVILLADGVETGASVTLNEENEWTASFDDLDKYAAGVEIAYTVAENKVEGYTASIAYEGETAIVTNSYTPETTALQVVKAWDDGADKDGIRPETVTVRLYANGEKTDLTLELNAEGKWTGAFENLPVYEEGEEIRYTVKEENVAEGYTVASIVVDPDTGIVKITNFHDHAVTEVTVYKEWDDSDDQDGIRPESVTIVLYADGEKVDTVELSETNKWKHTFTDLPLNNNGEEIAYTVKEVKIEGYTVAYKQTDDGWKVVNTHEPEVKEVTVSKVWYDNKDASELRPDSITVQLYKNGEAWGDKFQLSANNNWKKTFELPVCEDGEEIKWTVKELKVPEWYIVTYHQDSLTIMNTIQSDGSAKTGDTSNITMWVGVMSISAVAVVALLVMSKKKKKA